MAYNLTEKSIYAVKEILDKILTTKQDESLIVRTKFPLKKRHEIHQAIAAAKALNVELYMNLDITIKAKDNTLIIVHNEPDTLEFETEKRSVEDDSSTVKDEVDQFMVVAYLSGNDMQPDQIVTFQNYRGTLEPIKKWCEARGFEVLTDNPLTLRKKAIETNGDA